MRWTVKDTTKRFLRCPSCGYILNFTQIRKCCGCGKIMCGCALDWKGKAFCKKCRKEKADAAAKAGNKE
jgi:hypothetical protein